MAAQVPGTPENPNTSREYMLQCLVRWLASRPMWERDKFLYNFEKTHTKELTNWLTRHSNRIATENAEAEQARRQAARVAAQQPQTRSTPYQPPKPDGYKPPPALTERDKRIGRERLDALIADLFDKPA